MKSKLYLLAFLFTGLLVVSACNNKDAEKTIIGKWQIDSAYIENSDQVMQQWRDYLMNNYKVQQQLLQDSLAKLQNTPNVDSTKIMILQMQLNNLNGAIERYANLENFEQDIQMSLDQFKGGTFEFKPDSIMLDPRGVEGKWYIKNDSLYYMFDGVEEGLALKIISDDEIEISASDNVDNQFELTVVYIMKKMEDEGKNEDQK